MKTAPTLEHVAEQFAYWRSTRTAPTATTPQALKEQAIALTSQYSKKDILKQLHIQYSTIKHWAEELSHSTPAFIELTPEPPTPLSMNIELPTGTHIKLTGSHHELVSILLTLQQGGGR